LQSLRVDTGNPELDQDFRTCGIRVTNDYKISLEMKIE